MLLAIVDEDVLVAYDVVEFIFLRYYVDNGGITTAFIYYESSQYSELFLG